MDNDSATFARVCVRIQKNLDNKFHSFVKTDKLLIFGGGEHSEFLLRCLDFSDWKEVRICDNYKKWSICGIDVESPSHELFEWADVILISSFYKMFELEKMISEKGYKSKIVTLYNNEEKMPFYRIEIEMTAEKVIRTVRNRDFDYADRHFDFSPEKGNGERYERGLDRALFRTVAVNYFLEYIRQGDKVLDVGAGTGRLSVELYSAGVDVTALDISENMLAYLKKRYPNIKTVVSSGDKVPWEENTFDAVVSYDAMIHFHRWKDFLKEHIRVVKPNGYVIYNMYNDNHLSLISSDPYVRAAYIKSDGRNAYATVTRAELECICEEFKNVRLIEMIPYDFFSQTAFAYEILTRDEIQALRRFYQELCNNKYK